MLKTYIAQLEDLARGQGLDFYPVEFEVVPPSFMMEVAVYGLPVRMPHWSFGVRYIYQLVQHRMGHSRIFEVVFPGNPGRAFLANTNSIPENTLVVAHVYGHADFAKNNLLFKRAQDQVGGHVVEQAAAHAHEIEWAIAEHGQQRVEEVLDAALALEQHIDDNKELNRPRYPTTLTRHKKIPPKEFQQRFRQLPGELSAAERHHDHERAPVPPHPEADLLWFIAHYAPELEDWERDIFLAVRAESFYFRPVFACHIMNEGWASYWHARLLRESGFLPSSLYVDALKAHSDVVRPYAGDHEVALSINPYHLGFVLWDRIIEREGLESARKIMREEDDTGFLHNHLDLELAQELGLFTYVARRNGEIKVNQWDIDSLHEAILAPKYNFGAPRITVSHLGTDGALELNHEYPADGRGLELDHARKVLAYIHRVWRRPVALRTIDERGRETVLHAGEKTAHAT
jgi:stage V sporulation protein R